MDYRDREDAESLAEQERRLKRYKTNAGDQVPALIMATSPDGGVVMMTPADVRAEYNATRSVLSPNDGRWMNNKTKFMRLDAQKRNMPLPTVGGEGLAPAETQALPEAQTSVPTVTKSASAVVPNVRNANTAAALAALDEIMPDTRPKKQLTEEQQRVRDALNGPRPTPTPLSPRKKSLPPPPPPTNKPSMVQMLTQPVVNVATGVVNAVSNAASAVVNAVVPNSGLGVVNMDAERAILLKKDYEEFNRLKTDPRFKTFMGLPAQNSKGVTDLLASWKKYIASPTQIPRILPKPKSSGVSYEERWLKLARDPEFIEFMEMNEQLNTKYDLINAWDDMHIQDAQEDFNFGKKLPLPPPRRSGPMPTVQTAPIPSVKVEPMDISDAVYAPASKYRRLEQWKKDHDPAKDIPDRFTRLKKWYSEPRPVVEKKKKKKKVILKEKKKKPTKKKSTKKKKATKKKKPTKKSKKPVKRRLKGKKTKPKKKKTIKKKKATKKKSSKKTKKRKTTKPKKRKSSSRK